jgi:cobalt-zinc-cadmium efflux system outer membrane protein
MAPQLRRRLALLILSAFLSAGSTYCQAQLQVAAPVPSPDEMSIDEAMAWALQNNPELAALRQQYGIAAAEVVIARTYPHNPTLDVQVLSAHGPTPADVTNSVPYQFLLLFPVEIRKQGQFRRDAANAGLSRAEWEIVHHETALAIRVAKAFRAVMFQAQKLALLEETVTLNQKVAEQVRKLVDAAKLRSADLILANTEIDDVRAQLGPVRADLSAARAELSRSLGLARLDRKMRGNLAVAATSLDREALAESARERRPDVRIRQAAVAEAEAKLRLAQADRFGNPSIGPFYQFNESRVHFMGGQLSVPIPVLNTHRGDIQQRDAERLRAMLELRDTEVRIEQDVAAALARLENARQGVSLYEQEILPNLRTAQASLEKLFTQNDPGVDVLRLIDMRRKLLRARAGFLDAQWEANQAQADLATAVADPGLIAAPPRPAPPPEQP